MHARKAPSSRCRGRPPAIASTWFGSSPPAAPCSSPSRSWSSRSAATGSLAQTSVFAVAGDRGSWSAARRSTREVQRVARTVVGTSLLDVDAAAIEGSVRSLPSVAAASVDRAFPHTLVIRVAPVWPVGVARRGDDAWLVSGSNRVIRKIEPRAEPGLPRLWLPRKVAVELGRPLPTSYEPVTRVLAGPPRRAGPRRASRRSGRRPRELVVVLHSGRRDHRSASPTDILVKLAVAARVVPLLDDGMLYLDVSVPERPVAGADTSTLKLRVRLRRLGRLMVPLTAPGRRPTLGGERCADIARSTRASASDRLRHEQSIR